MKEQWVDIIGYENKYQISNLGEVKALNYRNTGKEHIINKKDNKGYLEVALWKNGVRRMFSVHRLVAQAFIPNPQNLLQVNHKDENKYNNSVDNLEWCTQYYNNIYGTRLNKVSNTLKQKHTAG